MSIYITPDDQLHVDHQGISLTCPHCQTLTHISPVASPKFDHLILTKPKHVGIVFRCDACSEPVFLKFAAKSFSAERIELATRYTEIERAPENFPLTYLPEDAEEVFREALSCFSAGCYNAFGAMCRRTAQSLFRELGERGKLELRAVLFGSDSDPWPHQPHLTGESAGILLEVMRDLLYQTFVRKARLLQAMTYRKYAAPQLEPST
jgi:hypothetical protein